MKICGMSGCPELTDGPYCPDHTPNRWAGSRRRQQLPTNWPQIRADVFARDDWTCQICGTSDLLQPECDHIGAPDVHHPDNLRTLCPDCHTTRTTTQAARARAALARLNT